MGTLISILIVAVLAIVFTIQNIQVVQAKLLFWSFSAPLALVVAATFVLGIILGIATSLYTLAAGKQKVKLPKEIDQQPSLDKSPPLPPANLN
jgi:uncharacterized integral membrane protein